ncbi:MAG TPA: histidinol dehydrogenase, partial [Candidatus Hypogeohydataceae bacterium YC40]
MMRVIKTWEVSAKELESLRRRLSPAEIPLPEKMREVHLRVFGTVLSSIEAVRRILADVKEKGDEAVLFYSEAFDGIRLPAEKLKVSNEDIEKAYKKVTPSFLKALRKAKENIVSFQRHIKLKVPAPYPVGTGPTGLSQNGRCLELVYKPM